jgi:fructose-1,6-bisphosphatase/sedoheptulose 1,7-bisphosphatase-like protein
MARAVQAVPEQAEGTARPCLCESYARVTERSALASARWLGRADQGGASEAACTGMHEALDQLPVDGNIVIGAS